MVKIVVKTAVKVGLYEPCMNRSVAGTLGDQELMRSFGSSPLKLRGDDQFLGLERPVLLVSSLYRVSCTQSLAARRFDLVSAQRSGRPGR